MALHRPQKTYFTNVPTNYATTNDATTTTCVPSLPSTNYAPHLRPTYKIPSS